jgi:glycosyltransferase involved in cell wall biosynthesis
MKLLFLCKRRPQGKDLLERPYGRFYYLPKILSKKGHEVHILLLGYYNEPRISEQKDGINWTSISLFKHGPFGYLREAEKIIKKIEPDWIIGFSDIYYGILAQRLGAKFNINSLIDSYDNFESYIPWLKPLHAQWRKSLSKATLVSAAGPSLVDLLAKSRPDKPTATIPMAADPLFQPMDKIECRKRLGLPLYKNLIGYSGSSIHASRGVNILFMAFYALKREVSDIELVLTGRKGRNIKIPSEANWMGYIPDEQMPLLMNSLDVLVVINQPSAFGNYSYPVKLYEAIRCKVPVAVSETLSTKWIMRQKSELLVKPGNADDLCKKIKSALYLGRIEYNEQLGWEEIGSELEILLKKQGS